MYLSTAILIYIPNLSCNEENNQAQITFTETMFFPFLNIIPFHIVRNSHMNNITALVW